MQHRSINTSEYQEIELTRLLEPIAPARETFDETKLEELIDSIRELGIIEPLCVEPEGEKFRIHAGHRRFVAARALGLERVPCRIFPPGKYSGEALKHHENKVREDLNAAEEAKHFLDLLERECGGDVDRLCSLVKERRDYVEDRLLLVTGDELVFKALSDGVIKIGVAQELNKISDAARRRMYLDSAMQNGATVRMVKEWRRQGEVFDSVQNTGSVVELTEEGRFTPQPAYTGPSCYICESGEDAHDMEILWVHRSCARAQQRLAERTFATDRLREDPDA